MHNYTDIILQDIKELSQKIEFIEASIDTPEGNIQICKNKGSSCHFCQCVHDGEKTVKKYLGKNDQPLIQQLAAKAYYKKLLPVLKRELKALQKFQKSYDYARKYEVYRSMHAEKQKHVKPLFATVESKVAEWKAQPARPLMHSKSVGAGRSWTCASASNWSEPSFVTDFGLAVRSKSEYMIAEELHRRADRLLFKYEQALRLKDGGVVYPDFEIISLSTGRIYYLEHFGMMDDATYFEAFTKKMQRYTKSGVLLGQNLIATYEIKNKPLHLSQIKAALDIIV